MLSELNAAISQLKLAEENLNVLVKRYNGSDYQGALKSQLFNIQSALSDAVSLKIEYQGKIIILK